MRANLKTVLRPIRIARTVLLTALVCSGYGAQAKPAYAKKEDKPCQYCHVSVTPDAIDPATNLKQATNRNNRGMFYALHNHSFEGYDELAVMGKKSPPVFHLAWKEELNDQPRRMAVADVTGDGKSRLILLNEKPGKKDAATLLVKKWDGKTYVTEFTGDVQGAPDRLAVGKFAGKDKPAVIVTADALWSWNGATYIRKPSSRSLPIFGVARLQSGTEWMVLAEESQNVRQELHVEFKAYRVDPGAAAEWLIDKSEAPTPQQVTWEQMTATPEFFTKNMGLGRLEGNLLGLWDVRKFGNLFLYYTHIAPEFAVDKTRGASAQSQPTVKRLYSYLAFRDATDPLGAELWISPPLDGIAYEVAFQDPQGAGKPGLLILTSESDTEKNRTLYFFTLD